MSDEGHNTFAGQAWTFAFAVRFVDRLRVGADRRHENASGKIDGQNCEAPERLR
jgi:hypothetical protein